jgi:nucleoside-diphosphate-sugar epimerase
MSAYEDLKQRLRGEPQRWLVTGAAGFIGSAYVRLVKDEHELTVLDRLTYAGRRENLPGDVPLVVGAIEDPKAVREVMAGVDAVVNFAADSHVDRSISDQEAFARTHVIGTGVLLDAARELRVSRFLRSRRTRCTARSRPARSPRSRRSTPPPPTRPRRPRATCSCPPTRTPTGSRR